MLELVHDETKKQEVEKLYDDWVEAIAIGGINAVNAYNIDAFILGGSGACVLNDKDIEHIQNRINSSNIFREKMDCRVIRPREPNGVGLLGAALIPLYYNYLSKKKDKSYEISQGNA